MEKEKRVVKERVGCSREENVHALFSLSANTSVN